MRANGSNKRTVPGISDAGSAAFAPAGDRIVVSISGSAFDGCGDLYRFALDGSDQQRSPDNCDSSGIGPGAGFPSWQPLPAN
jgi:hypothetical protein